MPRELTAVVDPGVLSQQFFRKAALLSPEQFRLVFKELRGSYPGDMARLCVAHIAENGLDEVGKKVLGWLCDENLYMGPLLDPEFLSIDLARRAFEICRVSDTQFSWRFSEVLRPDHPNFDRSVLPRALDLLLGLENYQIFLAHIKVIASDANPYIRSKAVKALCQIRPNKFLVERQMQEVDARVRANAIEAIWHVRTEEAADVFRSALTDCHHRVVFNALLGLYFLNDPTALKRMLELADSHSVEFRKAAVWAFAVIGDPATRGTLEKLLSDPSPGVRVNARRALTKLRAEPEAGVEGSTPLEQLPETQVASAKAPDEIPCEEQQPGPDSRPETGSLSAPLFKLL